MKVLHRQLLKIVEFIASGKRARASITTGASTSRYAVCASASTSANSDADAVNSATPEPPAVHKDLNVVITHSGAHFDSLATAVALAKLGGNGTMVVTPGGENPELSRFLALHRQLFEIVGVEIGQVVLVDHQFLKGMSTIVSSLLDLSGVDVILLVFVICRGRRAQKRNHRGRRCEV